ncbi:hypothetical protein B9Q02_04530 [Candidatus Marsarchaeota G1 archaeon BE_D]|uniref:Glycosyltransferase 2-like domain-containing protein n=1 Tax=Candidatus Marsarchaeota G1 archaeon BE_D TaxID=1978156 RepID=A0A2R6AHK9_9ARCH|nr:MAG: hypothetical protein B9Q02_04530 [Candidatus Marsarchaeota G1 archaeon BE_D]
MRLKGEPALKSVTPEFSIVFPVGREDPGFTQRLCKFMTELQRLLPHDKIEFVAATDVCETIDALRTLIPYGFRCFQLTTWLGKGGTLKSVLPLTNGRFSCLLDADTPISPKDVANALVSARSHKADVLFCVRSKRQHGALRITLSTAYNALVNLMFHTHVRDHQAGFKVLSRRAINTILPLIRTDGFGFDTELLVWAKKLGFVLSVFYAEWNEKRSDSTIPPLRTALTMLADLLALRYSTLKGTPLLKRVTVGKVLELSHCEKLDKEVGKEYMTTFNWNGKAPERLLRTAYFRLLKAHS